MVIVQQILETNFILKKKKGTRIQLNTDTMSVFGWTTPLHPTLSPWHRGCEVWPGRFHSSSAWWFPLFCPQWITSNPHCLLCIYTQPILTFAFSNHNHRWWHYIAEPYKRSTHCIMVLFCSLLLAGVGWKHEAHCWKSSLLHSLVATIVIIFF